MKKKAVPVLAAVVLIVIVAVIGIVGRVVEHYTPSDEVMSSQEYFGVSDGKELAIVMQDELIDDKGILDNGTPYLDYQAVKEYLNDRFYWDADANLMVYTTPTDIIDISAGASSYILSGNTQNTGYTIVKVDGTKAYIAAEFVQQYTNIDYEVSNNPDHVMIRTKWGKTDVATVKKNTQVRYQGGVKSPVLAELKKKDEVTVVESEQNWKKVRTADGVIGYVKNKALKNEEKKNITRKFEEQDYSNISKDYTINMTWHNVTNQDANNAVAQRIAQTKGLTTLAPTWIHVADTNGNISSIASADYVSYAHKQNVEVWMTVRDFDGGISSEKESYELLSYTSRRETLITQLIAEALRVGVDGINVDFEKISDKCGEHYIEFIRELSVKCRQNGLVLSVDNYVPKSFNTQYDRKEQGIVADYVVIMGYDEYYAGSPEAGPVSSYNYVKEGITETLKEVPAEKVISGIPFFTRLWKETPKTEEELKSDKGTDAEQYSATVESDAYGMDNAQAVVKQAGVDTTWDKKAGQNYATWEADGSKYEIWLEDSKSIEAKLKLMKKYKLAGTAEWSLGQESSDIWNLIQKYVN